MNADTPIWEGRYDISLGSSKQVMRPFTDPKAGRSALLNRVIQIKPMVTLFQNHIGMVCTMLFKHSSRETERMVIQWKFLSLFTLQSSKVY